MDFAYTGDSGGDGSGPKNVRGHGVVYDRNPFNKNDLIPPLKSARLEEEDADKFSEKFKQEVERINSKLTEAQEAYEDKRAGFVDVDDEQKILTEVADDIKELQEYVSSSTRFLPDFAIKTFQQLITNLINRNKEIRSQIMPQKKFQFSSKKKNAAKPVELKSKDEVDELKKEEILARNRCNIMRTSEMNFDLNGCSGRYILDVGYRVNKVDITLTNMKNCFIEIRGHPGSIRMKNIVKCVVLCGPTTFSIYGEDCQESIFAFACHQLRLHYSAACKIFLHVTSCAIIEGCREMEIGPYNYTYDCLEEDFKESGLDRNTNNYKGLLDFDWLTKDAPSPNWKLTAEQMNWDILRQQFKDEVKRCESQPY